VDIALRRAKHFIEKRRETTSFRLAPGDQVVFTGDLSVPRAQLVDLVQQSGLVVGGINKGTKLVVAADPDSLSGKASKARAYGIPVVTEAAFARMLADLY
jgi:DNA polymerase-3 subunit epsilon